MDPATVLLVEDQIATRKRLVAAIEGDDRLCVQAAVPTIGEARRSLATEVPDLLLVDLGLPDGDGRCLIEAVRGTSTACVVISVFDDEQHVLSAIQAGADGYLLKDAPFSEIPCALLAVLRGESPISGRVARYLVSRIQAAPTPPADRRSDVQKLTRRESDVLELLAKGFSYEEVGMALGMQTSTVGTHVKRIYRKLAVCSRGEAVFEALSLGLIRLNP
ncbi:MULTISPECIES: response regulator transcription factor [Pseudomonadota]|uniref:response regulator n=1 Tax=Pseudomonadota TaxID=1224 RepID=UPI001CA65B34|nr:MULTISPECIES: response regulator transcription factor [Pseudomonadota]MBY8965629.1 response regulator transcription factor [Algiphilus acroporae]MCI5067893.1 response regulator transcription factor [Acidovorax sp.]MCI5103896.1 response regulator transcription factor [Algiphilus sp.]